jgi:four helix bundle protein
MMRSSGSIMDNIAEGFGRGGDKEFKQFLWISKGSASELRSQIYRAYDREFFSEPAFKMIMEKANEVEKMIKGLINHIRRSDLKGLKYLK